MARLQILRPGQTPYPWVGLCLLLGLGIATTLADALKLPVAETRRANEAQQRVIIDAATGFVSGLKSADSAPEENAFDVGNDGVSAPTQSPPPSDTPKSAANDSNLPAGLPELRTAASAIPPLAVPRSSESLITAPAPEVTEKTQAGTLLPRRGDKGTSPARLYAQPFTRKPDQPLLAIVILDAGITRASMPLLMGLPHRVTIALSPYARESDRAIEALRTTGLETWAMLPAITERYPEADPGPFGLIGSMPADEQMRRLHEVMRSTIGSVGFVLPPDEAISSDKKSWPAILKEIDARGLALLSTHPTHGIAQLVGGAKPDPMPHRADLWLDPVPNEALIRSKLAGLPAAMEGKSDFVLVTSARPQTLEILSDWLKQSPLPAPVALAPLSAIYEPEAVETAKPEAKSDDAAPKKDAPVEPAAKQAH